jgi:ribosomal protein S18 acetylase RimI-like enzyme
MTGEAKSAKGKRVQNVMIRRAAAQDIPDIARLDHATTGQSKPDYWGDMLAQFSTDRTQDRAFLVAETAGRVVGFITGEIRAFEFGAERCGWVFAVAVDPELRVANVGTRLFDEICTIFQKAGVEKVSTLIERDSHLVLAFFRSQGMIFGRYIQMEKELG